jgi:hypothetical protein
MIEFHIHTSLGRIEAVVDLQVERDSFGHEFGSERVYAFELGPLSEFYNELNQKVDRSRFSQEDLDDIKERAVDIWWLKPFEERFPGPRFHYD